MSALVYDSQPWKSSVQYKKFETCALAKIRQKNTHMLCGYITVNTFNTVNTVNNLSKEEVAC